MSFELTLLVVVVAGVLVHQTIDQVAVMGGDMSCALQLERRKDVLAAGKGASFEIDAQMTQQSVVWPAVLDGKDSQGSYSQ